MSVSFAVIRVSTDHSAARPVMFADMLFKPVLAWMIDGLKSAGIEQFYLVGRKSDEERAMGCVPPNTNCVYTHEDELLPDEIGNALVLTAPVILTGREVDATVRYSESYDIPGVALVDGDRESLGVYYLNQTNPEWVSGRLQYGERFSEILEQEGMSFAQFKDNGDAISVESLQKLQEITEVLRKTIIQNHMDRGVNFLDPASAMVGPETVIGAGTVIYPQVILRGRVTIGMDCKIGPSTMITGSTVGDGSSIVSSQVNGAKIGKKAKVGPYAVMEPGAEIKDEETVQPFTAL